LARVVAEVHPPDWAGVIAVWKPSIWGPGGRSAPGAARRSGPEM